MDPSCFRFEGRGSPGDDEGSKAGSSEGLDEDCSTVSPESSLLCFELMMC